MKLKYKLQLQERVGWMTRIANCIECKNSKKMRKDIPRSSKYFKLRCVDQNAGPIADNLVIGGTCMDFHLRAKKL